METEDGEVQTWYMCPNPVLVFEQKLFWAPGFVTEGFSSIPSLLPLSLQLKKCVRILVKGNCFIFIHVWWESWL